MNLNEYVGLPFLERGRDRVGIDCWGLVALVYRERLGIELPSFRNDYQTTADTAAVTSLMDGNMSAWREIPRDSERPGDGVLMSVGGAPRHVGVVARAGFVLHAEQGAGSVIENYHSARLRRRVLGFYRHESQPFT